MKKLLVLILLLSIGLNVGLGVRLMSENESDTQGWSGKGMGEGFGPSGRGGPDGEKGPGRHGGEHEGAFWRGVMDRRLNHVADQLSLDEKQAVAFKKAHKAAAEKFLDQRLKVAEARAQLMAATEETDFETASIRPLIAEVGRQQAKLDSMVTETMIQEMEILNEDQRRMYMKILPMNRINGRSGGLGKQSMSRRR